jgi:hypothetical protein
MSRRGSGKGEGGDMIPVVLITREYIVIFLCVEIIVVPYVILSRSSRPIDLLGRSTVNRRRFSCNFRTRVGESSMI